MAKKKSKTQTSEAKGRKSAKSASPQPAGSEPAADQQREGGPRYHGAGWEQAAEDEQKGRVHEAQSADTRTELEIADEAIVDPGTRGAVFGRQGKGIVERDQPDDPAGPEQERDRQRHGSRPPG